MLFKIWHPNQYAMKKTAESLLSNTLINIAVRVFAVSELIFFFQLIL